MNQIDVTSDGELRALCEQIAVHPHFAFDTEFHREKTYYPVLALVQVAYPGSQPILIDPLRINDWEPFHNLLCDADILKILHAGRQDLEIFAKPIGKVPGPVFDTQIAASMCGLGEQMGYAALVQRIFGEQLQKSDGFTDWLRRPLTDKQMAYARNDVRYLIEAYERITGRLHELGRAHWVNEEIAETFHAELFDLNPDRAWFKVKKWSSLPDKNLVVLQALARWREDKARELDMPVRFVVSDEGLIGLARMKTVTLDDIKARRSLSRLPLTRIADDLMAVHQLGRQIPKEEWPVFRTKSRIPSEDAELIAELAWALLHMIAKEAHISPSRLVAKKELPMVIDKLLREQDTSSSALFHGWRYEMAGKHVERLVNGDMALTVKVGCLSCIETNVTA